MTALTLDPADYIKSEDVGGSVCAAGSTAKAQVWTPRHKNKKEAEAIEARAKLEILAGFTVAKPERSTAFAVVADEFLAWCFTTEYRSKWNTAARIQISFQSMLVF